MNKYLWAECPTDYWPSIKTLVAKSYNHAVEKLIIKYGEQLDDDYILNTVDSTTTRVPSFNIYIYTNEKLENTLILDELWKYLIPTGYNVHYMTKAIGATESPKLYYNQSVEFAKRTVDDTKTPILSNEDVSRIRGAQDDITDDVSKRVQNAIDTTYIYGATEDNDSD